MTARRLLLPAVVVALLGAPAGALAQDPVPDTPIVLPGESVPLPSVPDVPEPTLPQPTPPGTDPSGDPPQDHQPQPFLPEVELKPGLRLRSDGTVGVDSRVPKTVRAVIRAANKIAETPYKWGGGHAKLIDTGYDCSGSVSFALRGGGLLGWPLVSGDLAHWGASGRGRWITIFANAGHVYMDVGGLRYDTSGRTGHETRWQLATRPSRGFAIRHPLGL